LILRAEADQWSSDNTRQSGRDAIDHAPGQHDDRINAAAGAIVLAATRKKPMVIHPEMLRLASQPGPWRMREAPFF
jgi:hypothetical protein